MPVRGARASPGRRRGWRCLLVPAVSDVGFGFLLVGELLVLFLPLALRPNVERNRVLQRRVIIMNTEVHTVPHVAREHRLIVDDAPYEADGITQLHASFGFQDEPNVPAVLRQAVALGFLAEADLHELTYFLSQITIVGPRTPACRPGRPGCSSPSRTTPQTRPSTSLCPSNAPSASASASKSPSGVHRFGGRPRGGRRRRRRKGATPRGSLTARAQPPGTSHPIRADRPLSPRCGHRCTPSPLW